MQNPFPSPEDDDAEDVAWGLTTGAALWRQGERYDAIVWLKRAVEAANEAGAAGRADQLNRAATDLIAALALPPPVSEASEPTLPVASPVRPAPAAPKPPPPPRAPSPPAMRKAAPVPPKPPPPPKSRTPMPHPAIDLTQAQAPARAAMPSVTTSAPTMEALTHPAHAPALDDEVRRDAPPPPTILPDVPSSMPTPEVAVAEVAVAEVAVAEVGGSDEIEATPHVPSIPVPAGVPPSALVAALDALPLTPDQKRALAESATIESLSAEEDISIACLALLVDGSASAQATVADVTAIMLRPGELIYARSSIADALSLRLVAEADPTTIALWDQKVDEVLAATPDLVDRLKRASDRTQAIAGCTMGPVGERLDEGLRQVAIDRLDVRVLDPNEVIAVEGQPVPGMVIVGVGTVELEGPGGGGEKLGPGDFLFATQVLDGGAAPATARAGSKGAIVLFGARAVAHELLVTCPPLLEVFAGM